jgi:hypothetical protein
VVIFACGVEDGWAAAAVAVLAFFSFAAAAAFSEEEGLRLSG